MEEHLNSGLELKSLEDAEFLRRFKSSVAELERRSVLHRPNLLSASITFRTGRKPKFKHNLRDPERITAFLAEVRKFHLEGEPFFLPKVFNWLQLRMRSQELGQSLVELRGAYRSLLGEGTIRILHKDKDFSPKELLSLYLNGVYFHNDAEKQSVISELEAADSFPRVAAMEAAVTVARTAQGLTWIIMAAEEGSTISEVMQRNRLTRALNRTDAALSRGPSG